MKLDLTRWAIPKDGEFVTPSSSDDLKVTLRRLRNILLAESDWVMVSDSPIKDDVKDLWRSWRAEIRSIVDSVSISDGDEYVEIPSPPHGYPFTWDNLDYDKR